MEVFTTKLQSGLPQNFGNGRLVMSERAIFHYKRSTEIQPRRPVHAAVE